MSEGALFINNWAIFLHQENGATIGYRESIPKPKGYMLKENVIPKCSNTPMKNAMGRKRLEK